MATTVTSPNTPNDAMMTSHDSDDADTVPPALQDLGTTTTYDSDSGGITGFAEDEHDSTAIT